MRWPSDRYHVVGIPATMHSSVSVEALSISVQMALAIVRAAKRISPRQN